MAARNLFSNDTQSLSQSSRICSLSIQMHEYASDGFNFAPLHGERDLIHCMEATSKDTNSPSITDTTLLTRTPKGKLTCKDDTKVRTVKKTRRRLCSWPLSTSYDYRDSKEEDNTMPSLMSGFPTPSKTPIRSLSKVLELSGPSYGVLDANCYETPRSHAKRQKREQKKAEREEVKRKKKEQKILEKQDRILKNISKKPTKARKKLLDKLTQAATTIPHEEDRECYSLNTPTADDTEGINLAQAAILMGVDAPRSLPSSPSPKIRLSEIDISTSSTNTTTTGIAFPAPFVDDLPLHEFNCTPPRCRRSVSTAIKTPEFLKCSYYENLTGFSAESPTRVFHSSSQTYDMFSGHSITSSPSSYGQDSMSLSSPFRSATEGIGSSYFSDLLGSENDDMLLSLNSMVDQYPARKSPCRGVFSRALGLSPRRSISCSSPLFHRRAVRRNLMLNNNISCEKEKNPALFDCSSFVAPCAPSTQLQEQNQEGSRNPLISSSPNMTNSILCSTSFASPAVVSSSKATRQRLSRSSDFDVVENTSNLQLSWICKTCNLKIPKLSGTNARWRMRRHVWKHKARAMGLDCDYTKNQLHFVEDGYSLHDGNCEVV